MDLNATLGQKPLDSFMRGLVRGRYHSLLGAGASVGGSSEDGTPLPGAVALAAEMEDMFDLPAAGAAGLRRLYAAARGRTARNGASLDAYLKARFTNTTPPDWMKYLVQIPWAQIWTLNIDDCVERAYNSWRHQARQSVNSISWTERHRTARPALDETLLIHLHGKAGRAHREQEIVFDITAYVNAVIAQHRWHKIFGDSYPAEPFLIVGASLDSEIDLQVVLEQGRLSGYGDHPSIILLRTISHFQAEEYRRYGLEAIEGTADSFFEAVVDLLPQYLLELTHEEALSATDTPPEVYTFLSQWQRLDVAPPGPAEDRRHDFYAGHQPEWRDIMLSLPSERDGHAAAAAKISGEVALDENKILLLSGDAFSGKSTFLLHLAKELGTSGFVPFLYGGEVSPDVRSVAWWLQRHPRSILLLDDASDFAYQIEEMCSRVEGTPASIRMVGAERTNRARHIENVLAAVPHETIGLKRNLSRGEVSRLIDKLTEKRRLGSLTGRSRRDQNQYFDEHGRELFSSMAELERGRGFVARIQDEYAAVEEPETRRLLGATAIVGDLGYGLPLSTVKSISGAAPAEVEKIVSDGDLADLVTVQRGRGLRLRHRVLGSLLVEYCLDKQARFELARTIAAAMAPHVSPAAISAGTVHYRTSRALMTVQNLKRLFDGDIQTVLDWYETVESEFDWNARYWEQRALAAAEFGLFEPAYSWAREAVTRHEDSFTLNTVGTVLMQRAASEASRERWPTDSFELAEAALAEARDMEGAVSEYPYETFFHYVGRLVGLVEVRDRALNEQLRTLWMNWHARVLSLEPAYQVRLSDTLQIARAAWVNAGMG